MRTLDPAVEAELAKAVTAPGYLIEIDTVPPARFSTRGSLVFGGNYFIGGASVSQVAPGSTKAEITLPNHDNTGSSLVLGIGLEDTPVRIYAIYGDAPAVRDELWRGVVDGAEITLRWAKLTCEAAARAGGTLPDVTLSPPLCNHLPAPGTKFYWGGEYYTLNGAAHG